eukprot:gene6876-7091_t
MGSSTQPAATSSSVESQVGTDHLSYLLTWQGSQPQLSPVLFISHTDVVPVPTETLQNWTYPPFSGEVADGFIWGRGALDAKVGVICLLEAAAALLAEGYKPLRTLLFAFGHDEEVGHIASELSSQGIELEMVWDEGIGISLDGLPPFTSQPVALVGTAEKSYQSLQLTVHSKGGHSSIPPVDHSSIAEKLSRLLWAITNRPPQAKVVSPTREFLVALAPLAPGFEALSPGMHIAALMCEAQCLKLCCNQ